jgi:hypothetical protein
LSLAPSDSIDWAATEVCGRDNKSKVKRNHRNDDQSRGCFHRNSSSGEVQAFSAIPSPLRYNIFQP